MIIAAFSWQTTVLLSVLIICLAAVQIAIAFNPPKKHDDRKGDQWDQP